MTNISLSDYMLWEMLTSDSEEFNQTVNTMQYAYHSEQLKKRMMERELNREEPWEREERGIGSIRKLNRKEQGNKND